MFSFEGDYRRKPIQALGGSSRKEQKEVLLQRTQEERRKREILKKQQKSAVTIQSCYRSSNIRHAMKKTERQEFDAICQQFQKATKGVSGDTSQQDLDMTSICLLSRQLLFFYNSSLDFNRLTWLCQLIVKQQTRIAAHVSSNNPTAVHQIKKLLRLCCRFMESEAATASISIAIQLRMVEIFTDPIVYEKNNTTSSFAIVQNILEYLVQNGYYRSLRILFDHKVPFAIERPESLMSAQTSVAGTLLGLIHRPISLLLNNAETTLAFRNLLLQSLCREIFCKQTTEAVDQLLIPSFMRREPTTLFPFLFLLKSLVYESSSEQKNDSSTEGSDESSLTVEPSIWLLYSLLRLSETHLDKLPNEDVHIFLIILYKLVPCLRLNKKRAIVAVDDDDSDSEEAMELGDDEADSREVYRECLKMLESQNIARCLLSLSERSDHRTLTAISTLCYTLMEENCMQIHRTRLLYSLAFNPIFINNVWNACLNVSTRSTNGVESTLLQMLSRGLSMTTFDLRRIVPLLYIFSSHFSHFMMSLHDSEFHGDVSSSSSSFVSKHAMPFTLVQLSHIARILCDACLGIIELTHPDTKPIVGFHRNVTSFEDLNHQQEMLMSMFKIVVKLVKQLYDRDCRRRFCPDGHWLSSRVSVQLDRMYIPNGSIFVRLPFGAQSILNPRRTLDDDSPLLSNTDVRKNIVLSEMPFVVPFEERVKVFHRLVLHDKTENQSGAGHNYGFGHSIIIMVRRSHLYEDAFEKLSSENEPNIKKRMQVQLINFAGLDEAGIDGGGIFREFMSELMKTAFDPNRGFFKSTTDKLLYPNPQAKLLVDGFTGHYYFLGRILGKVIYENMLTELPFASFFLTKLLSRQDRGDVDVHHLASLDPEMYKNLLSLKDYDGDISDLGLDFTVVNNELGEAQVEELKPGGKDILVTNQNHIEYIHLMADYRLNKQMRQHCNAFRSGLADVININWLRMFDHNELQILISGAQTPIDLDDLRRNTNYSGAYGVEHPVIVMFWRVVETFTDKQKRQLLKFATSCSRPPLLGFKELYPAFCIHYAGSEVDRLPTASTCMNLLKLPEFQNEETLRQKLLYAIESGAGFELS